MEMKVLVGSLSSLELAMNEQGVIQPTDRPDLWFARLDGDSIIFANCMRDSGLSELPLDTILNIGVVDEMGLMSVETDEGWDFVNAADVRMNPPPEPAEPVDVEQLLVDNPSGWSGIDFDLNKCPKDLRTLMRLLPVLFNGIREGIYYDLMAECIMADMSIFGRPDLGFCRMNDTCLVIYYLALEEAFHDAGINASFSRNTMFEALVVWASEHPRNRFLEWIKSHKWDGKPRVATLFQDLFGATAPALSNTDAATYMATVASAWLVGAVARCYKATKHEIVPVFISPQGFGKGNALCMLAGDDEWYIDTTLSPTSETQKFLEATRGRIIVEMSEATQLRGDVEKLKSFISQKEDQVRKPYGRLEDIYPRHFILAASSNNANIFTDITGNRRLFPMYCDAWKVKVSFVRDRSYGQDYVEQVWAEAFHLFHHGARYHLTPAETELAEPMQDYATVENGNIIAIDNFLDDPVNGLTAINSKVSRAYIMEHVFGYTGLPPKELETAYRAWTLGTKYWRKSATTIRVDGVPSRGYIRICEPGQKVPTQRLNMVDHKPGDLREEFSKYVKDKRLDERLTFDGMIVDNMSREAAVAKLMELGYVYKLERNGMAEYFLGDKP